MNTYTQLINSHKGKGCFILAAGPSLYDVFYGHNNNLDMFKNNVIISINASIIACVERLGWLTEGDNRYWISDDSLTTRWSWWRLVEQSKCTKIVRDSWLSQKHYGNIEDFLYFAPRPTSEGVIGPDDIGLAYCSSAPSAIDLAIQMGCSNIYLLGLDHDKKDDKVYFWEYFPRNRQPKQFKPGQPPWKVQQEMYRINNLAYKALDKFALSRGCSIYNCSDIALRNRELYQFKYKDLLK